MDGDVIESIAEATNIPLSPFSKATLWADNFLHRAKRSVLWHWDRSLISHAGYTSFKYYFDAHRTCQAAILSRRPPIFLVPIGGARPLWMVETLGSYFTDGPVLFLLLVYWSLENPQEVEVLKKNAELHRQRFPQQRLVFFCNTPEEQRLLDASGLEAVVVHQNQLVSEQTFRPLEGTPVNYDAVYNAKIARFKRHYLAAAIERVLYVAYRCRFDMSRSAGRAYVQRILARSPQHRFSNTLVNNLPRSLTHDEVNRAYNEACVGLCLSAVEGGMYASVEYLLAGLPVVTTPSRGGRDTFFDDDFCVTAKPDCREIRNAVIALRNRNIPRQFIRDRTIKRIAAAQRESQLIVERILGQHGVEFPVSKIWPPPKGVSAIIESQVQSHIDRWRSEGLHAVPEPREGRA